MAVPQSLKAKIAHSRAKKPKGPLWQGPEDPGPQGGITQSLIGRWLVCRDRFRVHTIEGLGSAPQFHHRMEYGNMWHLCEEHHAANESWQEALKDYCRQLCDRFRHQQEDISHWYRVCKVQFEQYIHYWKKHPDVKNRKPIFQEYTFNVPYELPSGRTVYLRGKFDSVDLIGKEGIYLQENKAKGDINEIYLKRQLHFDLQTMLYQIALAGMQQLGMGPFKGMKHHEIRGVRYNVIRRPLSGGKFSIRPHKATSKKESETMDEFYKRLGTLIADECRDAVKENRDCWFFMRWKSDVHPIDIARFKASCLDPILEQICDWYSMQTNQRKNCEGCRAYGHYRMPYGVYSSLMDGGMSEVDEYLTSGSTAGLQRLDTLFPELES